MSLKPNVDGEMKILDFDIENRPLTYMGYDYTSADVTAIAASWGLDEPVYCWVLGREKREEMLLGFKAMYDQADMITGHYIRNHDLPIINGALIELGLGVLSEKLSSCTKNDCIKFSDLSKSQESIADTLQVHNPKIHMSQHGWRSANRLEPEGLALTEERCVGDVRQHQEMRLAMIEANMLGMPKIWRP